MNLQANTYQMTDLQTKKKLIAKKVYRFKKLQAEISALDSNNELKVSDHAMLRYLERVLEIDLKQIEKYILSDNLVNMINKLGNSGKFPHENGFQVVLKNNIVTTIIK